MKHKKQHYIPESYLQAWCDPRTPKNQTPYVWLVTKQTGEIKKRSPKKIFRETDFYTIYERDGARDLTLEYNLSHVESEFAKLRRETISRLLPLTFNEKAVLMMFTAAMFGRTKSRGKYQREQWQKILDIGLKMQEAYENASPEQRQSMAGTNWGPAQDQGTLSMDDVRDFVDNPMTSSLSSVVIALTPLLLKTPYIILVANDETGFLTSDNPCVWFDPALMRRPVPRGAGGLVSPTLEITLPISPNHLLFISSGLDFSDIYIELNDSKMLDNLNERTKQFSDEFFIVNQRTTRTE